jgi:hypothetical protein
MDAHAGHAARWADAMLLFEPVPDSSSFSSTDDDGSVTNKELHVRRLWNRAHLLKRLEELRRRTPTTPVRSRVGSPVWGATLNGAGYYGYGGTGGRAPVALTVPGVQQRGDIWW